MRLSNSTQRPRFLREPRPSFARSQLHRAKQSRVDAILTSALCVTDTLSDASVVTRRNWLTAVVTLPVVAVAVQVAPAYADDFVKTKSGLTYLDVREGTGPSPEPGDVCIVHWSGYTKGYQGKRIDNTSVRDEPYEFVLGSNDAIQAFQEAVSTMKTGGIRRIEVPGDRPELSYPRDRSARFTNELLPNSEGKIYKYRYGPQPAELGGQRALDFVLDNPTLQDFNRTLLYDIKLLSVRKAKS